MSLFKQLKRVGVSVVAAAVLLAMPGVQVIAQATPVSLYAEGEEEGNETSETPEEKPVEEDVTAGDGSTEEVPGSGETGDGTVSAPEEGTENENVTETDPSTENKGEEKEEGEEKDKDKDKEEEEEEEEDEEEEDEETNEELIAAQNINFDPDDVLDDFRFYQIDKEYLFAKVDLAIYESKEPGSRVVGNLGEKGVAYKLHSEGDGWLYIESGDVRGFARTEQFFAGEEATAVYDEYMATLGSDDELVPDMIPEDFDFESLCEVATEVVPHQENKAIDYLHMTVYNKVVDKSYAITTIHSKVFTDMSSTAQCAGILDVDDLCYIIDDTDDTWAYVESGDVRGFVRYSRLIVGDEAATIVEEKGEANLSLASESMKPKDNPALFYTTTSIKEGVADVDTRKQMLEYALQFVGNPYVWGGISLTNGTDCSGFVQQIYMKFGILLPRVAEYQAMVGEQIPVNEAAPGDLIFYAKDGHIFHVVMYAGDGKTIEAKGKKWGITTDYVNYNCAVWATRLLK